MMADPPPISRFKGNMFSLHFLVPSYPYIQAYYILRIHVDNNNGAGINVIGSTSNAEAEICHEKRGTTGG